MRGFCRLGQFCKVVPNESYVVGINNRCPIFANFFVEYTFSLQCGYHCFDFATEFILVALNRQNVVFLKDILFLLYICHFPH
jgi:hypothetical protein